MIRRLICRLLGHPGWVAVEVMPGVWASPLCTRCGDAR